MNAIAKAAVVAALLFPALSAHATLTVNPSLTITNKCNSDIAVAVRYSGNTGWSTTSFVTVPARRAKERVLTSNSPVFYYYAETLSGSPQNRWSGDNNWKVDGKLYPMKKTTLNLDQDRNRYHLQLSCRNG